MKKNNPINEIIKTGTILYEKNYIYATNGNISIRSGKHIYITTTGLCKGELQLGDYLRLI